MMLTLVKRLPGHPETPVIWTLELTADERTRSRQRIETQAGSIFLQLPRGTVLYDGDLLQAETAETLVRVTAKPEPVLTVRAATFDDLLKAAYHLGNRHVPVEIHATYLRLAPDPILQTMLEQLGVEIIPEIAPFQPEAGAYFHHH